MKPWIAALLGVAVGAGVTALVVSGGVMGGTAPTGETVRPAPGAATPTSEPGLRRLGAAEVPGEQPARGVERTPAPAVAQEPIRPPAQHDTAARDGSRRAAGEPCPEAQEARLEAKALRDKVAELEHKLARIDPRTFDLSQETLLRLAKRCELRWDLQPPRLDGPAPVSRETAEEAGLGEREQREVDEVMKAYNDRMLTAVRSLYVEVTGDSETVNLAPEAMLAEIDDKTDAVELKRVFQQIAAERAGLAAPPADLGQAPAVERLYRILTSAGDELEGEIAARIGTAKARALREHDGGWNSRSRSSHGCP